MSLQQKTVTGVFWSGIEKFTTLFIQLVCTMIIARVLSPADFGLVGMLAIFMAIAQTIIDSGFGQALIRKKEATEIDYSSVFYLNIVLGIILYIILYLLSPFIATFYNVPELESVSKIAFLVLPINALGLIQYTILNKSVNFKSLSKVTIISAIISGVIGITTAYFWRNVWALLAQNLSFYLLRTTLLWFLGSWKPIRSFSLESIKTMFSYSVNLLFTGLIGSVFNNLYGLVIGKVYNSTELGFYSQADRFQKLPATSVTDVIQRVSFPVLTQIQDEDERLREGYRKVIGIAVFIIVPIMYFFVAIAIDLFDLTMTSKWRTAAKYFQILCFAGALYPLHSINLNILNVKGNSKKILYLEIVRKILLVLILIISAYYEIIYMVIGQLLYSIIVLFLNLHYCGKEINLSVIQQLKDLAPTFLISGIMLIAVSILKSSLNEFNIILRMSIQLIVAIIIYFPLSMMFKINAYDNLKIITLNYFKK